ncbi:hypothetical protein SDC9_148963 [bioreactor metagenome]|uniref:Uncharacterized protein n=1 Tax=bioreactor metagenome TaxID=1076179 RepID=A0A645EII1_9ZZZZ
MSVVSIVDYEKTISFSYKSSTIIAILNILLLGIGQASYL